MSDVIDPQPKRPEQPGGDLAAREAMDRLNDNNRILLESRMADQKRPLTADEIEQIRAHYNGYVLSRNIKLSVVALQTSYSVPVISSWAAGKYTGDVQKVTRAVNAWLERDARREKAQRPKDYIKTEIAEDIRSIVGLADKFGRMAAIVVPAGAGKTYVLKVLSEELRGLYIYCHDRMSPRDMLRAIAVALGRRGGSGTTAELHAWIVETLKGTRRIIFLDEAHRLRAALGYVRSLYDEANVPIIMVGTADILEAVNDRRDGKGQFSSRTYRYNAIDLVRNAEDDRGNPAGKDLFSIEEVREFFAMKKIRLDRDALKFLWSLACLPNFGCLRLVESLTEAALELYADVTTLERSHLITSLKMLYGIDAVYVERLADRHVELSRPAKVA